MGKDYYGPLIDQLPPEVIIANGGRAAMIKKWRKQEGKNRISGAVCGLFGVAWGLAKAVILIFTVLYFVNALFF